MKKQLEKKTNKTEIIASKPSTDYICIDIKLLHIVSVRKGEQQSYETCGLIGQIMCDNYLHIFTKNTHCECIQPKKKQCQCRV